MNEFQEKHRLLSKNDYRNEKIFKLINENEVLVEGSLKKVANFISKNEIFDILRTSNGESLANDWDYATENEVSSCLYQAKLNTGFAESAN